MPAKIGSVVIDCEDPAALAPFWVAALGYKQPESTEEFIWMEDPEGQGIRLMLQKVDTPKTAKNRVHLDLDTPDLDAELARLTGLGATVLRGYEMEGIRWSVLQDPGGNEFCVAEHH